MATESTRLADQHAGTANWYEWGPYLSERQWGTVREDYSPNGTAWEYFPHDHARNRAYRWGEDGIAGISDQDCNICFAVAMWNGRDPIIKERLFGLTGNEGNHAEDVKELYYYLDNTPTHSYMRHLYKYPQAAFPYADLVDENRRRDRKADEYELLDTGVFANNAYFDVFTEYAKAGPRDLAIRITVHNRGNEAAPLTLLPTIWHRNLWRVGLIERKPTIRLLDQRADYGILQIDHPRHPDYYLYFDTPERVLFTDNETNAERVFGQPNASPYVKDAINDAVVSGNYATLSDRREGTKCSPQYQLDVPAGKRVTVRLRLTATKPNGQPLGDTVDDIFAQRKAEADEFYARFVPEGASADLRNVQRQGFAGMLWTKQYYNIDVQLWLDGDPGQPPPPAGRKRGRNADWRTLNNENVISMPDKWEYPWYAAWDLAFHCVPLAEIDPGFAKHQLLIFLREWYMSPQGQIPAYEWAFGDVNPPVHAWGCLEVFRMEEKMHGRRDVDFLKRAFNKLVLNFTWWVNRKDENDNNIFEGGFLGLDNIGVFDRSSKVPNGGILEQADGTAWMAMFSLNLLDMALEIAQDDPTYEDMAIKFLEHFVYISAALNELGHGDDYELWDEKEGFFYDLLRLPDGTDVPLKVRSLVGLSTTFAVLVLDRARLYHVPHFVEHLRWFRDYRIRTGAYQVIEELEPEADILLSMVPKARLERLLEALLDPDEFWSPGGIRSLSKAHADGYHVDIGGKRFGLRYQPGESQTGLFGGNSNWRGPVWIPMNYLLIRALNEYHAYYGSALTTLCPDGSQQQIHLHEVALSLAAHLVSSFTRDAEGHRAVNGGDTIYRDDPHFRDLVLFYEYFHGDTSAGLGASHQTGWTGLVASLIDAELVKKLGEIERGVVQVR